MNDNVKAFPGVSELPDNPMQIAPRPHGWCRHENVMLDEHSRTVQCADVKCGATLDPFNFLLNNAQTIQSAWSRYRHVTKEASEIADRVTALKKEEQRLRAMVKRLQEKTGAVLTVRGRENL